MAAPNCPREDELIDALGRGYVGPELAGHMAECADCTDLHAVAGALLNERTAAVAEAPVPTPSSMWWQIQIRQQQEAQTRAGRSLVIGQAVTIVAAIVLMVSLLGADVATVARAVATSIGLSAPLLLVGAVLLLFAPIAGYVAIRAK